VSFVILERRHDVEKIDERKMHPDLDSDHWEMVKSFAHVDVAILSIRQSLVFISRAIWQALSCKCMHALHEGAEGVEIGFERSLPSCNSQVKASG
jgi:hypothetical protein